MSEAADIPEIMEGWCLMDESWHFHRRIHERFNIVLELGEYSIILKLARSAPTFTIPKKFENSGRPVVIQYRGLELLIVANDYKLYTVYPKDALERIRARKRQIKEQHKARQKERNARQARHAALLREQQAASRALKLERQERHAAVLARHAEVRKEKEPGRRWDDHQRDLEALLADYGLA